MDFGVAASIVSFYPGLTWIEALGALVGYTKSTIVFMGFSFRAFQYLRVSIVSTRINGIQTGIKPAWMYSFCIPLCIEVDTDTHLYTPRLQSPLKY